MFNRAMLSCCGILLVASAVAGAAPSLETRGELFGSTTFQEWNRQVPANPDNRILRLPRWNSVLEVRPDFSWRGERHEFVLRSRHFLQDIRTEHTPFGSIEPVRESTVRGSSDLSDLYWSAVWRDSLSTTVGLQNYQWGPAEIFSPSNPFFHFEGEQRSFFFKQKGLVLARVNWTPSSAWSVSVIGEPVGNRERPWVDEPEFRARAAVKVDRQFANPVDSVGVVVSQSLSGAPFFGETLNFSPLESWSVYLDARHTRGGEGYRPVRNAFGLYDLMWVQDAEDRRWATLAVTGVRWEGRVDVRQEFIWNEDGFSDEEWDLARSSSGALSPRLAVNIERFYRPGLEFRRRVYSYTSLRLPDLGRRDQVSIAARWLRSLAEDSSLLQLSYEHNWNDSTVVSAESIHLLGDPAGEFRSAGDYQVSLGFRVSF